MKLFRFVGANLFSESGERGASVVIEDLEGDLGLDRLPAAMQRGQPNGLPIQLALSCLHKAANTFPVRVAQVLRNHYRQTLSGQLLRLISKSIFRGGIGIKDGAVFIDGED